MLNNIPPLTEKKPAKQQLNLDIFLTFFIFLKSTFNFYFSAPCGIPDIVFRPALAGQFGPGRHNLMDVVARRNKSGLNGGKLFSIIWRKLKELEGHRVLRSLRTKTAPSALSFSLPLPFLQTTSTKGRRRQRKRSSSQHSTQQTGQEEEGEERREEERKRGASPWLPVPSHCRNRTEKRTTHQESKTPNQGVT